MIGDNKTLVATDNAPVAIVCKIVAFLNTTKLLARPPNRNIAGPATAAIPAITAIVFFIAGDNSLMNAANDVNFLINGTNATAINAPNSIATPSTAEPNALVAPSAVRFMTSAIDFAAPADSSNDLVNGSIWSTPSAKIVNAPCAARPTSSFASTNVKPLAAKSRMASVVGFPVVANSEMIRRNCVPAIEPLTPAFANNDIMAVVSSNDIPADFAIGATIFIPSANDSMSIDDVEKDFAITSVTRPVSLTSKPNPRNVAPATSAARAKSLPDACAKFNVASVTPSICFAVKPSFANSVCSPATSRAEKTVERPNSLALSDNILNSSAVAPDTALTFAISASNPLNTLNDIAPNAVMGAVNFMDKFLPVCCILRPMRSMARSALFKPVLNGLMFAVNLKFKLLMPAICFRSFFSLVDYV